MNHMLFTMLSMVLHSPWVQALPTSIPNCGSGPGFEKNVGFIQKVVMIDEESRSSIEEFATFKGMSVPQARAMFAATGVMQCGARVTTVQLTGKRNLVTGVSHAFHQDPNCQFFEPTNCTIKFPLSGSPTVYKIKGGSMESGGCPLPSKHTHDWSVFELTRDVEGATPYDVPEWPNEVAAGTPILQVASGADNFRPSHRSRSTYNFQDCAVRNRKAFSNVSLQTDCDTGVGASGAAQLVNINGRLTLAAINVAEKSNLPNPLDPNDHRPPVAGFNVAKHSNISVSVEGEFLRILQERLNTRVSGGE